MQTKTTFASDDDPELVQALLVTYVPVLTTWASHAEPSGAMP